MRDDQVARGAGLLRGAVLMVALLAPGAGLAQAEQTAAACAPAGAPDAGLPRLTVTALGAHSGKGNITFTLYGERPARFLAHHGAIALTRVALHGGTATGCFAVSAPGIYAVAIYHDENDNHRFDRTLLGLPAEGYGFSNDAPATLGLPAFAAVKFAVPAAGTNVTVRLRY